MDISDNIRRIRKEKGLTQKKLGELCKIAEPTIRRYEAGTLKPKLETIEKIATALGVGAPALVGIEYYDKKYPDLAKFSKEYEGFIDYLNSLGYIVRDVYTPEQITIKNFEDAGKPIPEEAKQNGYVSAESYSVELIKDGISISLEVDEFEKLQADTKDVIALKLWQKSKEKK